MRGCGGCLCAVLVMLLAFATLALLIPQPGFGHDHARPDLNQWFDGLRAGMGPCCSNADGTALADVDWDSKDGHYRVRIEGQWWDVPEDRVIKEPNRDGRTMVWPVYNHGLGGDLGITIRCFMPGMMT